MSKHRYFAIDARALVDRLGGVPAVQLMLENNGFRPIPQRNIYKWMERSSIPSSRLAEILWVIDERKMRIDLVDFFVPKTDTATGEAA